LLRQVTAGAESYRDLEERYAAFISEYEKMSLQNTQLLTQINVPVLVQPNREGAGGLGGDNVVRARGPRQRR